MSVPSHIGYSYYIQILTPCHDDINPYRNKGPKHSSKVEAAIQFQCLSLLLQHIMFVTLVKLDRSANFLSHCCNDQHHGLQWRRERCFHMNKFVIICRAENHSGLTHQRTTVLFQPYLLQFMYAIPDSFIGYVPNISRYDT